MAASSHSPLTSGFLPLPKPSPLPTSTPRLRLRSTPSRSNPRHGRSERYIAARSPSAPAKAVAAARFPPSVVFRDLDADDFRHPLDKQNTLLLRAVPGLNELGKVLLGPVAEQVMILENIGTSVLVAENQLSDLYYLLVEAAKILNIEAPDFYVRQNPVPNAYTLAISGRKPFIVVHTSLVELLSRRELQGLVESLHKAWKSSFIDGSGLLN